VGFIFNARFQRSRSFADNTSTVTAPQHCLLKWCLAHSLDRAQSTRTAQGHSRRRGRRGAGHQDKC
jgi:hypothetical protein